MLIKTLKDMVYRNALKPAGSVFEFDGKTVPACAVAVDVEKPKGEAEKAKKPKGEAKQDS